MSGTYRCQGCRKYFPSGQEYRSMGLGKVCSQECSQASAKPKKNPKPRQVTKRKRSSKGDIPPAIRAEVMERDGCCRFCGTVRNLHAHHIRLKSQGVDHQRHNLIVLCSQHHDLVHTNTKYWRPILLAAIWLEYVEGRHLTVPRVEKIIQQQTPT